MKMNIYIVLGLIVIALGSLIGGYLIHYGQKLDSKKDTYEIISNDDNNKEQIIKNADSNTDKIITEIGAKNPDEELFITISKFITPDNHNDFRFILETTLSNKGNRDVSISDVQLIFYQGEVYTGGKLLKSNYSNTININQNSSNNRAFKFGVDKASILDISDDFVGLPFKIRLKLTVSSLISGTYNYELVLVENFIEKKGYEITGYTTGLPLPISIKLLPFDSNSKNIDRSYKIN